MVLHQKGVWGCVLLLLLSAAPAWAQARLPESLRKHVESKSVETVDVIVHGTPDEVRALAARRRLHIKKTLSDYAVLVVNGAGVEALSADVDHLSRDVEVTPFMATTNAAIGADQVHAGLEGLSSFTGAGVGVAIIDSGVWAGHRSLAGRVVFAKDFVSDDTARTDRAVKGNVAPGSMTILTATARTSARRSPAARRIPWIRRPRRPSAASRPAPT